MEQLVGEMKALVERLTRAAAVERPAASTGQASLPAEASRGQEPRSAELAGEARGAEMAEALAAAVERLRARAEATPPLEAVEPATKQPTLPAYKHSMSWIGRWRIRRKQRRSR
jgi:hypothetical protein